VSNPTNPTRTGYGFVGWYADAELTDEWRWNVDRMPDESITLYAKWQKNIDGVLDDYVADAGIGETGQLMMALGALVFVAVIFALIGMRGMAVMIPVIAMFTTFIALGWIPGWMAVVLMMIMFGITLVVIKGTNGGGDE
jgi:uncharacterized repeat protein (TIGR02543 family)